MMNKSRSLLLLSVLAVLFAACEEGIFDNAVLSQDYSEPVYSITAYPSDIIISSEGGSSSIALNLSHNLPWKLTAGDSWIRVSDTSGIGKKDLTLTIDENPSTDTRSGKLQFEARKKSATVTVMQMGAGKKYFILSPESLSFSADGGNKSIVVSTNLPWTVTASDSWIWLSADSGTGDFSLTVIASENATTSTRSGTVTFSAGGDSYTVNVTQTGTEEVYFVLSPESLSFPVVGGSKSIGVSTNLPWTATASDSWIWLSADSGTGDFSLTVIVNENATESNRSGTVTFSAGGNIYNVNVTQKGTETNNDYLTFEALENASFTFSDYDLQYSLDEGTTWTALPADTPSPTLQAGERIMWKASGLLPSEGGIGSFRSTGEFNAEGNIMSLLFGDYFVGQTSLDGKSDAFANLFSRSSIINAGNLVLPATTLASSCYWGMFSGCTGLTTAPELPATMLADGCYGSMFKDCRNLTTAPQLPATTLAEGCYVAMFDGCTSLTTAPVLPVTTLASSCYYYMFRGCTGLTTAPKLPATTLAADCYREMFSGCTGLTTASDLPATTLADNCYSGMFDGCTGLTTAPDLPAMTLANMCYGTMFSGCTSLSSAPMLPATTLAYQCYQGMFFNCTNLQNVPELLATTLADDCYRYMFWGCTRLSTAPKLPATTLSDYCYSAMFRGCSSLTTVPDLPATTLTDGCYADMFWGCTKLDYIKCLATDILATDCTSNWVNGVASSGTFVKNASMTSWTTGSSGIPSGWTVTHEGAPFSADFTSGNNGFSIYNVVIDENLDYVWAVDSKYGWKASAFRDNTRYVTDSYIVSPVIDLTSASSATLTFSHAARYFGDSPTDLLSVLVSTSFDGDVEKASWVTLTVPTWPSGGDWAFVDSGDISLAGYVGTKVYIAFRYTSTSTTAPTWEIKSLSIK